MFDVCVLFFGHKLKIQRQIENKYSNLQIKIHKKTGWTLANPGVPLETAPLETAPLWTAADAKDLAAKLLRGNTFIW